MKELKKDKISLKSCICVLLTLCMLITLIPGMSVTAKAADTATVLTLGTKSITLKSNVERTFTFTADEAGEYSFWIRYSSTNTNPPSQGVNVAYDDKDIYDMVTTDNAYSDSRQVISLKANETLTFTLSCLSANNLSITIGRPHSGSHTLSAPKLIESSNNSSYGNTYCEYVCACTKSNCPFYVKWCLESSGADVVAGNVSPGYRFEFYRIGARAQDSSDYINFKEGTDYTLQIKKKATEYGKTGIACIHLNSAYTKKLGGPDFKFNYVVTFTLNLSNTAYTYNGKVKTPSVNGKSLYTSDGVFKKNRDFTVTYSSGRKNVGTYKAVVKGKGLYSEGKWTLTFKINPKGTALSSLTAASKAFTVKWKAQKTQTTGYQIRYSLYSTMKSAKTVAVTSNKTTAKKISSLKSKKKYYVQIRTYKTVSGTKYYSSWSAKKAVTTK